MQVLLTAEEKKQLKKTKKYLMRKSGRPETIVDKIKLWPSKDGILHGLKSIKVKGDMLELTTHCEQTIRCRNSKNSRAARWLRNKWYVRACPRCRIPAWKMQKFSSTSFI